MYTALNITSNDGFYNCLLLIFCTYTNELLPAGGDIQAQRKTFFTRKDGFDRAPAKNKSADRHPTGGIKNARLGLSNRAFVFGEFYAVICASLMVLSLAS